MEASIVKGRLFVDIKLFDSPNMRRKSEIFLVFSEATQLVGLPSSLPAFPLSIVPDWFKHLINNSQGGNLIRTSKP